MILAVNHYNNIEELPAHFFQELRHFFEEYKTLEKKTVKVEDFGDKAKALNIITDAIHLYKKKFAHESIKCKASIECFNKCFEKILRRISACIDYSE